MTEQASTEPEFSLRLARPGDYQFALNLYLDGSKELLKKIGRWDEKRVISRFKRAFKLEQARIICSGGEDVGWIQICDFARRLHLRQLHLIPRVRGRGIGTRLIDDLHARGVGLRKPVTLDVIHGNRAKELYLRLGFRPTKSDLDKTRMVWRRLTKQERKSRRTSPAPN